jgi:hypothetical protein
MEQDGSSAPVRASVRRRHAPEHRKLRRVGPTIARARSRQSLARRLLLARRQPAKDTGPYAGIQGELGFENDLGFKNHSVDPRALRFPAG